MKVNDKMKIIKIPIAWIVGILAMIIVAVIIVPTFIIILINDNLGIHWGGNFDTVDDVLLWIVQQYDKVYQWSVK